MAKMSLKLLVDKKDKRVLFAEASKEFVDFLFHIFSLPLSTIVNLLGSKPLTGCLANLKKSIDTMDKSYLQQGVKRGRILNPKETFNVNKFIMLHDSPSVDDQSKVTSGYVKDGTYMITDDLVVKPMSTISTITLINKLGVNDLGQLEEKVVSFHKDQCKKLLKNALKSNTVLTKVFLGEVNEGNKRCKRPKTDGNN